MDEKSGNLASTSLNKILNDLKEDSIHAKGPGLYEGLMGICICYFILSEVTNEIKYNKIARKLLVKIQQSIPTVNDIGFANGLAGIGWGVEWLVQNQFIKANTDVILEDMDDEIYGAVVFAKDIRLSLAEGSIGKAMYFLYRIQAKNPRSLRYRTVCNLECLVLLSDEISEKLLDKNTGWLHKSPVEIIDSELAEIAQSLILMLWLNDKKINTETTIEAIKSIIIFFEKYTLQQKREAIMITKGRGYLHLVYAYRLAGKILEKENFTDDSPFVNEYLKQTYYISKNINDFEDVFLSRGVNLEESIPQIGNRFLSLLKNINSIKNTNYCYEAFMLKSEGGVYEILNNLLD